MKALFSSILVFLSLNGLLANEGCQTWYEQSQIGDTTIFQAFYYAEGDSVNNPSGIEFVWTIGNQTATGNMVVWFFPEDGTYNVCLTATYQNCTATYCDSVVIGGGNTGCNLSLQYAITHPYGANAATGSIDIDVTGGTGNYAYYWSNGAATQDIYNLLPGEYTVFVVDQDSCTLTRSFYLYGQGDSLPYDSLPYDSLPNDSIFNNLYVNTGYYFQTSEDCSATVYATIYGGTAPYSYLWSTNSSEETIENACGNQYYCLTVSDALGLSATSCVYVQYYSNPDSIVVIDTIETTIERCMEDVQSAQIVGHQILGTTLLVDWQFILTGNEEVLLSVPYSLDTFEAGQYNVALYVYCNSMKSVASYFDKIHVTGNGITGIEDNSLEHTLSLYPNPVLDTFFVEFSADSSNDYLMIIVDMKGTVVYSQTVRAITGENKIEISADSLNKGIYIVRLLGNKNFRSQSFFH